MESIFIKSGEGVKDQETVNLDSSCVEMKIILMLLRLCALLVSHFVSTIVIQVT